MIKKDKLLILFNMKFIRNTLKLLSINLAITYAMLLFIDKFIDEDQISNEKIIINVKKFPKNITHDIYMSDLDLKKTNGLTTKKSKIETGNFGEIIIDNIPINDNEIDLIFLGGSTTECYFVEEENRFPKRFDKLLDHENKFKIMNFSRGGKNSYNSLLQIITQFNDFKIKNIVLLHNINDLIQLLHFGSYTKGTYLKKAVFDMDDLQAENKSSFFIPFKLYRLIKKISYNNFPSTYAKLRSSNFLDFFKSEDDFTKNKNKYSSKNIDFSNIFKSNLELIVNVCKNKNINLILMTQFNRLTLEDDFVKKIYKSSENLISYKNFVKKYKEMNNVIREIANSNELLLIDLDSLVPKNKNYLYDSVHLNDNGSIFVSEIIYNKTKNLFK